MQVHRGQTSAPPAIRLPSVESEVKLEVQIKIEEDVKIEAYATPTPKPMSTPTSTLPASTSSVSISTTHTPRPEPTSTAPAPASKFCLHLSFDDEDLGVQDEIVLTKIKQEGFAVGSAPQDQEDCSDDNENDGDGSSRRT